MSRKAGFKHTEETRKKISETRILKGIKNTKEAYEKVIKTRRNNGSYNVSDKTKEKISKTMTDNYLQGILIPHWKGKKASEDTRKKMREHNARYWKGKKLSDETKDKLSISNKGKHPSPNTEFKKGHINSEINLIKIREARAKQIFPVKDTSIEIKIQNFLKELNLFFLTHQYMEIEHGYQCDILIPSMNLVIEVDGNYWHGNPKFFPNPNEWQIKQIEKDKIRTQELIESGFKVLRFWECDINFMELNDLKNILEIEEKKSGPSN